MAFTHFKCSLFFAFFFYSYFFLELVSNILLVLDNRLNKIINTYHQLFSNGAFDVL